LRSYKYIFITLFLLIAAGVILAVISACTTAGSALAVTGALAGMTALVCLAFYCIRFNNSANQLVDMLENAKLGHIKMKTSSALGPLAEAVVRFATGYT